MQPTPTSIWEQFHTSLQSLICHKVNHEDRCHDILQDLYLKIFTNINKVEHAQNIRAYVFQMAHNTLIDHYRRAGKAELTMDTLPEPELTAVPPSNEYKLAECLLTMINTLPPIYSEALTLTELQGLTQKQFAEKMGITLSTAKSRVQRARKKLKEEIINCCQYEFDKYGNILSCCENSAPRKTYC